MLRNEDKTPGWRWAEDEGGADLRLELPSGVPIHFQKIPKGSFRMGSRGSNAAEQPRTKVIITDDFYLCTFPVTQEQFQQWTESEYYKDEWFPVNKEAIEGGQAHANYFPTDGQKGSPLLPAERVTWDEAVGFADWLSDQDSFQVKLREAGLSPASYQLRLPSEAEWEYACRGGTHTAFWSGEGESTLKEAAWFQENSERQTHPVGSFAGLDHPSHLFDIHGNVSEWCLDFYAEHRPRMMHDGQIAAPLDRKPARVDVGWVWPFLARLTERVLGEGEFSDQRESRRFLSEDEWRNISVIRNGFIANGDEALLRCLEDERVWPQEYNRDASGYLRYARSMLQADAYRVLRGGSCLNAAAICRSAYRNGIQPGFRNRYVGFRLALVPGPSRQGEARGREQGAQAAGAGKTTTEEESVPETAAGAGAVDLSEASFFPPQADD